MLALLVSLSLNAAPALQARAVIPTPDVSLDRAVLQFVVDRICSNTKRGYHVLSSTAAAVPDDAIEGLDPNLVRNLIARNSSRPALPSGIGCKQLKLEDDAKITRAVSAVASPPSPKSAHPYWGTFDETFPGATGITHLSLPAYSGSFNEALVYVDGICGGLCGSGFIWRLRLVNGQWTLLEVKDLWNA